MRKRMIFWVTMVTAIVLTVVFWKASADEGHHGATNDRTAAARVVVATEPVLAAAAPPPPATETPPVVSVVSEEQRLRLETWEGLAKVCYHEAARRRSDCLAIWQTAQALRGCVNDQGAYVRCTRPHVRREHPIEALRRHSGRVLGVKPATTRRTELVRGFHLDASRPEGFTEAEWEQVRPYWLEVVGWAHEAITRSPRVCPRSPITWGGSMDQRHVQIRHLVPVRCGSTANTFYVQGPRPEPAPVDSQE